MHGQKNIKISVMLINNTGNVSINVTLMGGLLTVFTVEKH